MIGCGCAVREGIVPLYSVRSHALSAKGIFYGLRIKDIA